MRVKNFFRKSQWPVKPTRKTFCTNMLKGVSEQLKLQQGANQRKKFD